MYELKNKVECCSNVKKESRINLLYENINRFKHIISMLKDLSYLMGDESGTEPPPIKETDSNITLLQLLTEGSDKANFFYNEIVNEIERIKGIITN